MKGAGSFDEPGRHKHWRVRAKRATEARSEARESNEPGTFSRRFRRHGFIAHHSLYATSTRIGVTHFTTAREPPTTPVGG